MGGSSSIRSLYPSPLSPIPFLQRSRSHFPCVCLILRSIIIMVFLGSYGFIFHFRIGIGKLGFFVDRLLR
ncbi:hypothetical protein Nepgr_008591 [Nepenthes gracilis]|uniref:Uncharacterized protein n=1 Tax=Nepenthes gracilis TaxID=150966 RepID=A0AAD3XJK9_NEPGR|nr:hypothetical protein Nepgr_008591 [Nepenthes gracilis]